jgi:flagellar protein FlaF
MYQFSYAEIIGETPADARVNEREAIDKSIALLTAAQEKGVRSRESVDAVLYLQRLWSILIEDLAAAENGLPEELRASLISIGLWILREAENIRLERSANYRGIIDVSQMIRDGLK